MSQLVKGPQRLEPRFPKKYMLAAHISKEPGDVILKW